MEWVLPIQKMELGHITMGTPNTKSTKPIANLSYTDGSIYSLPSLSLIFPPLKVESYDPSTGRLELDTSALHILSMKLTMLQDTLLEAIHYNQYSWFSTSFRNEDIQDGFQPLYKDSKLILHCPVASTVLGGGEGGVPVWWEGGWQKLQASHLAVGSKVRVAVKVQGISFLLRSDQNRWTSRSRVQHRILGVIPMAR
jgi:hypothetical protein